MSKKAAGIGALIMAVILLLFPRQTAAGASAGLSTCLTVLIPSLYPFLVLTVFVTKSGISTAAGRRFGKPFSQIFRLPPAAAASLLMGMFGGYPTGARGAQSLYESGELTEKQAEHLVCISVNGGPAFIMTAVGLGFLGSAECGQFLLTVHLISGVLVGIVFGFFCKKENLLPPKRRTPCLSPGKALVTAARDGAVSMMMMCCFVILFSSLLNVVQQFFSGVPLCFFAGVSEVTLGCRTLASVGVPLWCISLVLGWGGLCVHLQVLQGLSFKVHLRRFFLCRLLQGISAAVLTIPFESRFLPAQPKLASSVAVFGSFAQSRPELSGTIAAAAALIILCTALLFDSSAHHNSVV